MIMTFVKTVLDAVPVTTVVGVQHAGPSFVGTIRVAPAVPATLRRMRVIPVFFIVYAKSVTTVGRIEHTAPPSRVAIIVGFA